MQSDQSDADVNGKEEIKEEIIEIETGKQQPAGRNTGHKLWLVFGNGTISLVTAAGTSFISVAQLFFNTIGKSKGDFWDGMSNHSDNLGVTVVRDLGVILAGLAATGGIIWLNVSGIEGALDEFMSIFKKNISHKERTTNFLKFVGRVFLTIPAGVAMAVLADRYNWPYLLKRFNMLERLSEWLYGSFMGITWVGVGLGISGVTVQDMRDLYAFGAPSCLYGGIHNRAFENIIYYFNNLIELKLHGQGIENFNQAFYKALNLNTEDDKDVTPLAVGNQLNQLFSNANPQELSAFFEKLAPILSMEYPTIRSHWGVKGGLFFISAFAAFIGTWSLKGLTMSGFEKMNDKGAIENFAEAMAWMLLIDMFELWTSSLYRFLVNSLNPKRHIWDTLRYSSKGQISLRSLGVFLASSFGVIMALIAYMGPYEPLPLIGKIIGEKAQKWLEAIVGTVINALIGLIGLNAVWKYFAGWLGSNPGDNAYANVNAMKRAFMQQTPEKKQQILRTLWNEVQKRLKVKVQDLLEVKVDNEEAPLLSKQPKKVKGNTTLVEKIYNGINWWAKRPENISSSSNIQEEQKQEDAPKSNCWSSCVII